MVATFYIQQLITSFVASSAFGILFNVPKSTAAVRVCRHGGLAALHPAAEHDG